MNLQYIDEIIFKYDISVSFIYKINHLTLIYIIFFTLLIYVNKRNEERKFHKLIKNKLFSTNWKKFKIKLLKYIYHFKMTFIIYLFNTIIIYSFINYYKNLGFLFQTIFSLMFKPFKLLIFISN